MRRRSTRGFSSTDPNINQILELPLRPGSKEELTQDNLKAYNGRKQLVICCVTVLTFEGAWGMGCSLGWARLFRGGLIVAYVPTEQIELAAKKGAWKYK